MTRDSSLVVGNHKCDDGSNLMNNQMEANNSIDDVCSHSGDSHQKHQTLLTERNENASNNQETNTTTQSEQSWILLTPGTDYSNQTAGTQSIVANEKKEEEGTIITHHQQVKQKVFRMDNENMKEISPLEYELNSPSAIQLELAEKGEFELVHLKMFGMAWYYNKKRLNICYKCCLLSTPMLCLCWSAIILLSLFFVACFGYYSHMPIDSNGSCSTLYYNEKLLGPVLTMASVDLGKEKQFFSSLDFYNASSVTSSDNLPINYYNTLMTHNSYHKRGMMASMISSMNYEHESLTKQLNGNVRGLELDIHLNRRTERFQVYHIPLIDDKTNCNCFLSCLLEIKNWITANTNENGTPDLITIFIEPKYARDYIPFCRNEDKNTLPNLMNEILRIFPSEQIFSPAKLKGQYSSLRSSVNDRGWPLKNSVRGMVLFVLNLWDENDDCKYLLKNESPSYSNNVVSMDLIFYREYWNNMASVKSDSVFFEVDDARVFMNLSSIEPMLLSTALVDQNTLYVEDPSYIISSPVSKAVQHGYIIRCTAGGVTELRARISMAKKKNPNLKLKDLSKTEACLRSGAQLLNTDFPHADLFTSLFTNQTFTNPLFNNS